MSEREDWRWCSTCQDRVEPDEVAGCEGEHCPMKCVVDIDDELHRVLRDALKEPSGGRGK